MKPVTEISISGGYPKFISQGLNDAYLPVWLQKAGYNTYYTGKLFNSHTIHNYNAPFPAGFNGSDFLLDPYTYDYLNSTFQRNRDPPVSHEGEYSTDVLAGKAYGFLEDAVKSERPFFLAIAPIAPHSNLRFHIPDPGQPMDIYQAGMTAPIPAERHQDLFKDVIVPRTPNFNPEKVASLPSPFLAIPPQ
jgi:arylsulfatase A-like enzyme